MPSAVAFELPLCNALFSYSLHFFHEKNFFLDRKELHYIFTLSLSLSEGLYSLIYDTHREKERKREEKVRVSDSYEMNNSECSRYTQHFDVRWLLSASVKSECVYDLSLYKFNPEVKVLKDKHQPNGIERESGGTHTKK